jgi:hypothetical protein
MTPLTDRVRTAIQAKAGEVPPEAVPPLRLPARGRRFPSLVRRGGGSPGARARWRWLSPVAAAVGVIAAVTVAVVVSGRIGGAEPASQPARPPASQRWPDEAARWVASQVSHTVVVSCDPLMCRELRASGFPASGLLDLRSGAGDPLGSSVVVATARIRSDFGRRLTSAYAPQVLARFGSGDTRVAVRVIAPHGEAAYRAAFSADLALRKQSGAEFLSSSLIGVTATAGRQLEAGRVDSRLLIVVTALEVQAPLSIVAFGDSGPGAAADIPLRVVTLRSLGPTRCSSLGSGPSLIAYLRHMGLPQFRPGQAGIVRRLPGGCAEIRIEFPAPSVLGLLSGRSS